MQGCVLIVDDDPELRETLVEQLRQYGMEARGACDGKELKEALEEASWDLLVLDMLLPDGSGIELCRELRCGGTRHASVPILFLSPLNDTSDCVLALEMGGDDYLIKPFSIRELIARVHALLRRTRSWRGREQEAAGGTTNAAPERGGALYEETVFGFDQWRLYTGSRRLVAPDGEVVPLSAAEYRLLRCFLDYPYQVLSREQLMAKTAGRNAEAFDRSIDVQISRLRARLNDGGRQARIIRTMRGDGYMLAVGVKSFSRSV